MKFLALVSISAIAARPNTSVCNNCPTSETCYYPGPTESQYIECYNGKETPFECPSKSVWDSNVNSCIIPSSSFISTTCTCDYLIETCYFAGSSEKEYIECHNGYTTPHICPSQEIWDTRREACVIPYITPECTCPDNANTCYYAGLTINGYIECHGGKVYPKECKSGAIWDSIENACVFPPNVPDCECYGGENTCFYSGPNNKVFIECNSGKKITIECPTDLVWDDIRKSCVVPFVPIPECTCDNCGNTCYYAGSTINGYIECHGGKVYPKQCPFDYVWDSMKNSCIAPTIVPDCVCPGGEESCYYAGIRENEFFECCNNIIIPLECPSEYVWDSIKNSCVMHFVPECTCPDNVDTCYYVGPTNTEYYECHNGHLYPKECMAGYVWDINTKSCVYPYIPTDKCTCPGGATSCYYAGNRQNEFYECCNGKEVPLECPTGLVWNDAIKSCIDTFNPENPECVCPGNAHKCYFDGPTNTGYFECRDGKKIPYECMSGYIWDSYMGSCQPVGPSPPSNVCANCPWDIQCYFATTDPGTYIQCSNGQPVTQHCPSGLVFNTSTNTCGYPSHPTYCDQQCPNTHCIIPSPDSNIQYFDCPYGLKNCGKTSNGQQMVFDASTSSCVSP